MDPRSQTFEKTRARMLEHPLNAAMAAKVLCSAIFVSGRDSEEALQNSVIAPLRQRLGYQGELEQIFANIDIDTDAKAVHITIKDGRTVTAKFYGDQGCVILPQDATRVFFNPIKVKSSLPDPTTQLWPMGDNLPDDPLPAEVDEAKLNHAVNTAFANPNAYTTSFVVVYKGKIIAERYALGVDKDTQLESWSMGKSITSTLIGVLIQEGHFGLNDPAPIPEWQVTGDPRSRIRISDLLRMSSGLKFSHMDDPKETWEQGIADHMFVYCAAVDVFQFSISRPPEFPPNTVGRYRNCDPLTLGCIIKRTVTGMGEEYLSWPQRALFDKIGIHKQILETDAYGNFIMTGFDYGTARNWARLGLLYLWDGTWMGERILPEGYVEFVSTPAPAWEAPEYGGQFWVNGNDKWNLPRDAFLMLGADGQYTAIVPSLDLVVVRMGHRRGGNVCDDVFNNALSELTSAIGR